MKFYTSSENALVLAKELMGSSVETRTDVSIYEASKLDRRFDIILCMGVYYHLVDPFYAFSEVRHCCHESSTVVFEGDFFDLAEPAPPAPSLAGRIVRGLVRANKLLLGGVTGDPPSTDPITDSPIQANYDFGHPGRCFVPSVQGLCKMLEANYFRVLSQSIYHGDPAQPVRRVLLTCQPFTGENPLHCTRPPFGLHRYDPRYA